MSRWTSFLNSLATRGGAILILGSMTVIVDVGAFVVYLRHDLSVQGLAMILSSGGVLNALMVTLKGSSDTNSAAAAAPVAVANPPDEKGKP